MMMKRKSILWAALILAVVSLIPCTMVGQEKKSFTITGKASDFTDGKKVYLIRIVDREVIILDSAIVAKNSFVIKGVVEEPFLAKIGVLNSLEDSKGIIVDLFVESGDITLGDFDKNISNDRTATGTPLNDKFSQFCREKKTIRNNQSITRKDAYEQTFALVHLYVKENIDNELGLFLFERFDRSMPKEMRLELAHEISLKHNGLYAKLYKETLEELEEEKQMKEIAKTVQPGNPYKNISGQTTDGKELSLKSVVEKEGNRYVLLEFWATWCGPCMREVPHLKEAYTKFHGKGFEIYSMSIDEEEDRDKWMQTIQEKGMGWTNTLRTADKSATQAYGVQGIPANFLIDCSTGKIIATNLRGNALSEKLSELYGE